MQGRRNRICKTLRSMTCVTKEYNEVSLLEQSEQIGKESRGSRSTTSLGGKNCCKNFYFSLSNLESYQRILGRVVA